MKLKALPSLVFLLLCFSGQIFAQKPETRMYTEKDASGIVNNAMLYIDDEPLNEIVYEKELLNIQPQWNYADVIEYLNKSLNISLKPDIETAICLERIGDYLYEAKQNNKATYYYYVASAELLQQLGYIEREAYMNYYIGSLCFEMKNKKESDEWFRKMVEIKELNTNEDQSEYAKYLITAIDNFYSDKNYASSAFYLEKYLMLGARSKANNAQLGQACLMLGDSYWNTQRKDEALLVYPLALPFVELAHGKNSVEYRDKSSAIADILFTSDKKPEAVKIYKDIFQQIELYNHEKQTDICANMLDCYLESFDFQGMLPVLERLKVLTTTDVRRLKNKFLQLNEACAALSLRTGKYDIAEKLYTESAVMNEQSGEIADAGRSWLDLSSVYLKMYMPEKALLLADKGYAMLKTAGKPTKTDEIQYLRSKGVALMMLKDYEQAEILLQKALKLQPRSGVNAIDFASSLGLTGINYWFKKDYAQAEKTFLEALEIANDKKYNQFAEYGSLNGNLALVYGSLHQYDKAVSYSRKGLDIIGQAGGKSHADYLIQLSNYSKYQEAAGNNAVALEYALQANDLLKQLIDKNLMYWSAREMEIFISNHAYRFMDYFNSYYFRHVGQHPELSVHIYNNQLFMKGLLLNSSVKFQQAVNSITDTSISNIASNISANRAKLEALYAQPVASREQMTEPIEQENIALQKELKSRIVEYGKSHNTPLALSLIDGISCTDISKSLRAGEAAIEFISFRYHDIVEETDSIYYAALVMRNDFAQPAIEFLTVEKEILPLISMHPDELYAPGNLKVYDLIWKPIEKHLQGVEKITYSPSGLLNRIAFAAIPSGTTTTLSDTYGLYNVSSTRKIIEKVGSIKSGNAILFGGIDYNHSGFGTLDGNHNEPANFDSDTAVLRSLRGNAWQYLPGTLQEVNQIANVLQNSDLKTESFSGIMGSEAALKQLPAQKASIIHIASHGFTITDEKAKLLSIEKNPVANYVTALNPLLKCGLLFAGANISLSSSVSGNDGILTAFELANLDFQSVALFVLSACETGLGEIKGSEGVYGLQRALFMSGAGSIVVSLWEVPDFETSELMTLFYSGIKNGINPEEAFYAAQKKMKERYPEQPSLWAGFVFCR